MNLFRLLLLPFSILYASVSYIRNFLFDKNILKSTSFSIPVISIGNLTVGGTGKTPHTEYLIRLLKDHYTVATLSRGYGRKTKGFVQADSTSTATQIGDEPLQYKKKFPEIDVAVCEKRVMGVQLLTKNNPDIKVVLLDDAFQHRSIKAGLSILLIDYEIAFKRNFVLPSGTLRENSSGIKRADIIIITKTPTSLTPGDRRNIEVKFKIRPYQKIYLSFIKYRELIPVTSFKWGNSLSLNYFFEKDYSFVLMTGIANPKPLISFLQEHTQLVHPLTFPDHHTFSPKDLSKVKDAYAALKNEKKILLTTEKDAMRFDQTALQLLEGIPFFYLPVEIAFHNLGPAFDEQIVNFCNA